MLTRAHCYILKVVGHDMLLNSILRYIIKTAIHVVQHSSGQNPGLYFWHFYPELVDMRQLCLIHAMVCKIMATMQMTVRSSEASLFGTVVQVIYRPLSPALISSAKQHHHHRCWSSL